MPRTIRARSRASSVPLLWAACALSLGVGCGSSGAAGTGDGGSIDAGPTDASTVDGGTSADGGGPDARPSDAAADHPGDVRGIDVSSIDGGLPGPLSQSPNPNYFQDAT